MTECGHASSLGIDIIIMAPPVDVDETRRIFAAWSPVTRAATEGRYTRVQRPADHFYVLAKQRRRRLAEQQLADDKIPSDALRFVMVGDNPAAVPDNLYPTEVYNIDGDSWAEPGYVGTSLWLYKADGSPLVQISVGAMDGVPAEGCADRILERRGLVIGDGRRFHGAIHCRTRFANPAPSVPGRQEARKELRSWAGLMNASPTTRSRLGVASSSSQPAR